MKWLMLITLAMFLCGCSDNPILPDRAFGATASLQITDEPDSKVANLPGFDPGTHVIRIETGWGRWTWYDCKRNVYRVHEFYLTYNDFVELREMVFRGLEDTWGSASAPHPAACTP